MSQKLNDEHILFYYFLSSYRSPRRSPSPELESAELSSSSMTVATKSSVNPTMPQATSTPIATRHTTRTSGRLVGKK